MATVQSEVGKIFLMEDFGKSLPLATTDAAAVPFGDFMAVGQGIAETDSGIVSLGSDGLNGVGQLTTTDEDVHAMGIQTGMMFDVGKMGTIVAECRVRFSAITTGEFFFGLSDVCTDLAIIEGAIFHGNTATLTNTASDGCGFLVSSELTDSAAWHVVYNGGSAAAVTASATNALDVDMVAGDFNILRLEIDNNGTVRWYIDGVLKKTVEGAVSTTTDMCLSCLVESKTTACKTADVDYVWVSANRDWTV
jgi:hypothetical protein